MSATAAMPVSSATSPSARLVAPKLWLWPRPVWVVPICHVPAGAVQPGGRLPAARASKPAARSVLA